MENPFFPLRFLFPSYALPLFSTSFFSGLVAKCSQVWKNWKQSQRESLCFAKREHSKARIGIWKNIQRISRNVLATGTFTQLRRRAERGWERRPDKSCLLSRSLSMKTSFPTHLGKNWFHICRVVELCRLPSLAKELTACCTHLSVIKCFAWED